MVFPNRYPTTGILFRYGMPVLFTVRLFCMRPPRTSVWLFRSTTEVSASRLENAGEPV